MKLISNHVARVIGIKERKGTDTLRKTFDIMLEYEAPNMTIRYIGITKDELDDVYLDLNL